MLDTISGLWFLDRRAPPLVPNLQVLNTACFQHIMTRFTKGCSASLSPILCKLQQTTSQQERRIPIYILGQLNKPTGPWNVLRHGSPTSLPQSSLCSWNSDWKPHSRRPQERRPKQQLAGHIVYHSIKIPAAKLFCIASLLPVLRFGFFLSPSNQ